jgi:isopenicillin-N N-acyltransferase-like protein
MLQSPRNAPRSLIFTTHGTLGQIGMNDGTYGVTWPFVVRKALRQTTFDAALACITDAHLAGGHSFLLLDARGDGANVEATSTRTVVERLDTEALVHTNHCLFSATREVEADRPAELKESTTRRLLDARSILASTLPHTAQSLMSMLRDEKSICRHPGPPFNYESSGAVVMRPGSLDMWACWGIPSENEFERFNLA